jgi:signal peptidase I
LKKIVKWIAFLIIILVVAVIGTFIITSYGLNWRWDTVMSESMVPTLQMGGVVITRPISTQDIKVGDIITFWPEGHSTTHRVVDVYQDKNGMWLMKTKGDANNSPDTYPVVLSTGKYYKLVWHVPGLGYAEAFIVNHYIGILIVVVIIIVVLFLVVPMFTRGFKEIKEKEGNKSST